MNNAKISAIEITESSFTPIRVNAGGPQVTDGLGRVWAVLLAAALARVTTRF